MKKIYYKRILPAKKVKVATFKGVSKDWYSKNLPIDFAIKQENLKTVNGALLSTLSPKSIDLIFDENIKKVIPYNDSGLKLFVECDSKNVVLEMRNNQISKRKVEKFCEVKSFTEYKYADENYIILATDDGLKKLSYGIIENSDVNINFSVIFNHYYRIFGAEKNSTKLLFSDDFAPFNWTQSIDEGGYINLPSELGAITDILSFNQNLIVCQEDGFTRITAFSEQDDFVVKSIASPNNIKTGSVVNCGDFVMFATNKGLGIFDGYNCKTICEELSGHLKECNVQVLCANDYCYFLCKNKYSTIEDSFIIAYNLSYKDYHFITCDNVNFIAKVKFNGNEKVLVCYKNEIKVLSEDSNSENKIWQSGSVDFGKPAEYKLLKRIVFGGKTVIDLKITADDKNYFYNIAGKREILLNLKAKQFEIEIAPKGRNINVPSPVIEYVCLEEN